MHKYFTVLTISLFCFFTALFTGCQQVVPELSQSSYSVIFDYDKENAKPESRLCIFLESESDVRRYDSVKIISKETGYIWNIDEIARIKADGRQWAGNTNSVVPENEKIPNGLYEITFYNADEKNTTVSMNVSYDTAVYELKLEKVEEYMANHNATNKIVIYDEDGAILYFGEKTEETATVRDIWNNYINAKTYQDIWCTNNDVIICIMPLKKVELNSL